MDVSLIAAPIPISRNETQLRCALPADGRSDLRTESWSLASECGYRIDGRQARRDRYIHHEVAAIRGRKNLVDEEILNAIANGTVGECQVQRALHLPAELLSLPLSLAVRRRVAGVCLMQSFNELRIRELWPFTATSVMSQIVP